MKNPLISVVIPTLERAYTLNYTLRTCLLQDFEDVEFLVSDNCSSPSVREVTTSFNDPRIRYVRTPQPYSMIRNWQFAFSQAAGEYITYLGCDDGLLPGGLNHLSKVIADSRATLIRTFSAYYEWPDHPCPSFSASPSYIFGQGEFAEGMYQSLPLLGKLLQGEFYRQAPMIYRGLVKKSKIEAYEKVYGGGSYFDCISPDVYTAYINLAINEEFYHTNRDVFIEGVSGDSTGLNASMNNQEGEILKEFHRSISNEGYEFHPLAPINGGSAAYMAECAFRFYQRNQSLLRGTSINLSNFYKLCLVEALLIPDETKKNHQLEILERTSNLIPELHEEVVLLSKHFTPEPLPRPRLDGDFGATASGLYFASPQFKISTVEDAYHVFDICTPHLPLPTDTDSRSKRLGTIQNSVLNRSL